MAKATLKHRDRIVRSINLQETDRCPIDFGGTNVTSITEGAYKKLTNLLKIDGNFNYMSKKNRIVCPSEHILKMFDIDTRPILPGSPDYWQTKFDSEGAYIDEWKVKWRPNVDGRYVLDKPPLKEATKCDLDKFDWPITNDPGRIRGLKKKASEMHQNTDYAIILSLPSGIIHQCQYLRGFSEYLIDIMVNKSFARIFTEKVEEVWSRMAEQVLEEVAGYVDVVLYADDVGIQDNCMFSPDIYREIIKPSHKRIMTMIKEATGAKLLYHTCGSVVPLIDDFIELGVDVLNPIQITAKNMEPKLLKERFGEKLAFWGGIDTQKLLPFRSKEDVEFNVKKMVRVLGDNGGYILASVHNIQDDTNPENIITMLKTSLG